MHSKEPSTATPSTAPGPKQGSPAGFGGRAIGGRRGMQGSPGSWQCTRQATAAAQALLLLLLLCERRARRRRAPGHCCAPCRDPGLLLLLGGWRGARGRCWRSGLRARPSWGTMLLAAGPRRQRPTGPGLRLRLEPGGPLLPQVQWAPASLNGPAGVAAAQPLAAAAAAAPARVPPGGVGARPLLAGSHRTPRPPWTLPGCRPPRTPRAGSPRPTARPSLTAAAG